MLRISVVAAALAIAACSQSVSMPTFEEQLVGTWECSPANPNPARKQTQIFTYEPAGAISGSVTFEEASDGVTAILRGMVTGSWEHKDGKVLHTLTEEFEELRVNGEVVPADEVNPMIVASFRPETTYDVTVDLDGDTLTWFEDDDRAKKLANCTRQPAK